MEEKNIIENEVVETAEEIVQKSGSGIGGKLLGGALVAGLVFAGYKLIKKFKSNKEDDYVDASGDYDEDDYVIDEEEVEELNEKLN